MQLVEKHVINKNHAHYKECDKLCFLSKNLYNKATYLIRQDFINNNIFRNYYDLRKILVSSDDVDYHCFPGKVSNGILRLVDKNWKSFFRAIKDYVKNKHKYSGKPKLPNYKHKESGRNVIPYEKMAISKSEINKKSVIHLSKTSIKIPTKITYEQLQAARIVPRDEHFVIEIIYNKQEEDYGLSKENVMGIDLGVNNLATVVTTTGKTTIINGKPLKSINQYFNKKKSKLQSKLKAKQFKSHRIIKMTNKRNNKVDDYLHKCSRFIINYCLTNNIGRIVIGKNKNWKQNIKIGKQNNQTFVNIPFIKLINMIQYKAQLVGIDVILTEESYTSKCSFIDNEDVKKHSKYQGKRVKRGMFRSKDGFSINADVNGALNIIKKVVPLFNIMKYGIEDVAVHPLRISFS